MSIEAIGNVSAASAAQPGRESGLATLQSEAGAFVGGQIGNLSLSPERRAAFQDAWPSADAIGVDAFVDRLSAEFSPDGISEQSDLLYSAGQFAEQVSVHLHVHQLSAAGEALRPIAGAMDHASAAHPQIGTASDASNWLGAAANRLGETG